MIITILGWTGALLSCLLTIPQAVRTLRSDRLDGLSATTYWIIFGNAAVWAAWSVLTGEYAAGVPALVNGPAALLILRRLHHSQQSVAKPANCPQRAAEAKFSRFLVRQRQNYLDPWKHRVGEKPQACGQLTVERLRSVPSGR
jgi:uncharacterized protein with PQ loop repeat